MPENWVQRPVVNTEAGSNPGAPLAWGSPENPDDAVAGYGYVAADTSEVEETFYYHSDHLGSTAYITDQKANVTQYDAYLLYGELLVDEHSSSADLPYKFNGKELDEETGLYYYGARYMNPIASIWYGVDPLTEKYPNVSAFAYCAGNPVKLVDPDGRFITCADKDGTTYMYYKGHWHEWAIIPKNRSEIMIGKIYKPKKGSFMDQVLNCINSMSKSEFSEVKKVIAEVVNSRNHHHILDNSGDKRGSSCVSVGNGGDDQIQMNLAVDNKSKMNSFTFYEVFAHEIKHAYDRDCGIISCNTDDFSHIDNSEYSTVYFENLIRKEENKTNKELRRPQRTTYGSVSIYDTRIPKEYRQVTLYRPEVKRVSKWKVYKTWGR